MRKIRHKLRQRAVVCQQPYARLFHTLQKGIVRRIVAAQLGKKRLDGRGIGIAHQSADKLRLPLERAVGCDFFIGGYRLVQIRIQTDFFQRII